MEQESREAGEDLGEGDTEESGKNQFNYSERAAQTFNNPLRERGVSTEPPPVITFGATLTQWEIYDFYMTDYAAQIMKAKMHEDADKKGKKVRCN